MRGLKSTLFLIVVLGALVGYIYYLNGRDTSDSDLERAFTEINPEDIEEVQIMSADGET